MVSDFTAQPHKEERFMYVAYSSLCLNAALAVSILCIAVPCLVHKMVQFVPKAATRIILSLTIAIIFVGISLSRSLSLYAYYNAPTKVLQSFHNSTKPILASQTISNIMYALAVNGTDFLHHTFFRIMPVLNSFLVDLMVCYRGSFGKQ